MPATPATSMHFRCHIFGGFDWGKIKIEENGDEKHVFFSIFR